MKKLLTISIITTLMILSGCKSSVTETDTTTPVDTNTSNVPVAPATPELSTNTNQTQATDLSVYLIALNDNGKSGIKIGCGDSLIPVIKGSSNSTDKKQLIKTALENLFAIKTQNYGQSGLYNALYNSNLKVDSIETEYSDDTNITVKLSGEYSLGGVCDNPRFENQITQTIKQFTTKPFTVLINSKEIHSLLSEK